MSAATDIVAKLNDAPSAVAEIALFKEDSNFVFNFLNGTKLSGQDGFVVPATSANFPALLTGNGAMVVGVLGPCGLSTPHLHPRGTELQLVIQGGPIQTGFVLENGARLVKNTVPIGSATIFPKGSLHFQQNLGCDTAVFVASFDFVDPGTLVVADNFFALDKGVVNATLGDIGVELLNHLKLPPGVVLGAQECLDRCHIDRSTFNFSSTFGDYVAFSNSTWTTPSSLPSAPAAHESPSSGAAKKSAGTAKSFSLAAEGSFDIPFSQNPLRSAVIGLSVASAALLIALIAVLILALRRRSGSRRSSAKVVAPFMAKSRGYPYVTPYDDAETLASRRPSIEKQ